MANPNHDRTMDSSSFEQLPDASTTGKGGTTDQTNANAKRDATNAINKDHAGGVEPFEILDSVVLDPIRLKSLLIQLKLVTEEDWVAAEAKMGSDTNKILDELTRQPAKGTGAGEEAPVLTQYQYREILSGKTDQLRLDHYIVLDRLGEGGMGSVFKVRNMNTKRIEAMKTVQLPSGEDSGSRLVGRFAREVEILAQFNHHYITQLYNSGRQGNVPYLVMEFVAGKNLKEQVESAARRKKPVPYFWAADCARKVASALKYAHEKGVIHRDIKPNNIMLTTKNSIKVLDMGIARLLGSNNDSSRSVTGGTGAAVGTPEFMSPEQWQNSSEVTTSTDIYSLGCTLYFLLTGRAPYTGGRMEVMTAHWQGPIPHVREIRNDVPKGLDAIVRKMMAKLPCDRFQSAQDVINALEPYCKSQPPRRFEKWRRPAGIVAGVLTTALITAFVLQNLTGAKTEKDRPIASGPVDGDLVDTSILFGLNNKDSARIASALAKLGTDPLSAPPPTDENAKSILAAVTTLEKQKIELPCDSMAGVLNRVRQCKTYTGEATEKLFAFSKRDVREHCAAKEWEKAVTCLSTMLECAKSLNEGVAETLLARGQCYVLMGKYTEAQNDFELASKSNLPPKYEETLKYFRGYARLRSRKALAEAADDFEAVLQKENFNLEALTLKAMVLAEQPDRRKEAIELAEKAEKLCQSDDPNALAAIAHVYHATGTFDKAEKLFQRALNRATDPAVKQTLQQQLDWSKQKQRSPSLNTDSAANDRARM